MAIKHDQRAIARHNQTKGRYKRMTSNAMSITNALVNWDKELSKIVVSAEGTPIMDMCIKTGIKKALARGYQSDLIYNEDLKQDCYVSMLEYHAEYKALYEEYHTNPTKKLATKLVHKRDENNDISHVYHDINKAPIELVYSALKRITRNAIERYMYHQINHVNASCSIDSESNGNEHNGEFSSELSKLNILDRLQDRASLMDMDSIGLVDTLEGSLTKTQYKAVLALVVQGDELERFKRRDARNYIKGLKMNDYNDRLDFCHDVLTHYQSLSKKLQSFGI